MKTAAADPARLFEGAGPLVERLRAELPFISGAAMVARARQILAELAEAEQIAVLNAHPRIGERAEQVRAKSAHAFREQGYDGGRERRTIRHPKCFASWPA